MVIGLKLWRNNVIR